MAGDVQRSATLHKSLLYASQSSDLQVSSASHGSLAACPSTKQNAVLEPTGTSIVLMACGSLDQPRSAFSLESCFIDPLSERFLPDIAWSLDGKFLCALTTHGQIFILTDTGNLSRHFPGPLVDPSQFAGQLPVSFTAVPDGRLLVLTANAAAFSIDLKSGRIAAESRFRRGFRVGRAVSYHEGSQTLLIIADGHAATAARPGAHCASTRTPSVAAWSLKPRSSPRLLASVKGEVTDAPAEREFWRAQVSPNGRILAVCASGAWSLLAGPEAKFQPLQVQREDVGEGVGVSALAWEDETNAVVAWGDGRVFRLDFDAMTSFYVPMRDASVTLEEGSQVAWAFAGGAGSSVDARLPPQLTALEPAWEDAADVPQGQHYTGTAEEMGDRKGVPIPHKFGVARRIIGWRVSALQETSAEELIQQMLPLGARAAPAAVDRALAAAQSAGLPPAQVWRRVWAASAQHAADVDRVAAAVSGDIEGAVWLEGEARALAGASSAAAVALLTHALAAQETGDLREAIEAAGELQGSAAARTAAARMGLLYRLDLAHTYAAVHGENADVDGLREFVAAGPAAAAAGFAAAENVAALETVLSRHACSIGGTGALEALSQLPDATEPALYVPLLQRLLQARPNAASAAERDADLVEEPAAVAALRGVLYGQAEVTERFRAAEVELGGLDGGAIVAPDAADAWVAERMMGIDDRTGLLVRAAALAKAWFAHVDGPPAPELVGVHIMHTLFRNIHVLDAGAAETVAALSLRDFLGMTELAQTRCVLRACFPDTPADLPRGAELISRVAAPALSALPAREQTLANVLQLEFPAEPQWTVATTRCDLHADCALFGGLAGLSSAVLRLAKSFIPDKTPAAGAQWAQLLLLLDAVLSEVRAAKLPIDGDQREYFRVRLEEAGDLVRAARVFSRHGMHLMACVLTASDRSSVSGLLRGLLMNATAAAAASGDPGLAFSRLWNDLRDLHMYVFEGQGLSLAYLLREFLRATLLARQWEVAERHLEGNSHVQLSPQGVARTLSSAAREMFTAAAELSPADPALAACLHCLSLRADRDPELQRSLDLVQALRIAASELAVPVDAAAWAPYVFTHPEITTLTNPMTASATSVGSPPASPSRAHTEAGLAALSGMMQQLLADAVTAAAPAPLTYYPPLCELIQLLYGSDAPPDGTTKAEQQAAWLQVVWMLAGAPGGRDAAAEIAKGLVREGCAEVWPMALHLAELPTTGEAAVAENREFAVFALQHCDAASMPKCLATATAANGAAAAAALREGGQVEEAADDAEVEMPGGAAAAARLLKAGGLEELEAAARSGDAVAAAAALRHRALACLEPSGAAGGYARPPLAASQAAVACLFELLMQEGPGSLHAFVEECGALERPERALAAAAAAAALYVLRCANGELQPAALQLSQGPLISAARNAASARQATSGPLPGSLAEATALLDSLVSAGETAARGTELERLVQMLSGTAGADLAADEILQEVCTRFAALEFGHACAIAEYFSAGGPCPLPGPAAWELSALELHPAAVHAILHAHAEVAAAAAADLPPGVAAGRALLRTWIAVQPLLGAHAAGGWLLTDLDVAGATALEAAEVIVAAEHERGAGAAAEAAALQALLCGVGVHAIASHFPGVLAALDVEEAAMDEVTGDAIVAAATARSAEVAGELAAACVGDAADTGAGMQSLHGLIAALDGSEAATVPCCARARRAVTGALLRMQQELPAAALGAPVMHEVIALQEALVQPGRWGSLGDEEAMGVLRARARATLGVAWQGTGWRGTLDPLEGRDTSTAAAAERTLLELLDVAEADEQALAVFEVLRDVFEFGGVFGGGACMSAAATGAVSALCRRGRCVDAANVLRLCGGADVEDVKRALEAAAGPWCAAAVGAASGHAALREWAVEKLMHARADELRESGELDSAAVLGLLLWGLSECGGKEAARLWKRDEVGALVFDAVGVLPMLEEGVGSEALGLPGLAARLTAEAGYAGSVIAWEAVAKYVGMHPVLRTPEGLLANLGRYLAASEARLHLCGAVLGHVGRPYMAGVLVRCGHEYSGLGTWLKQAQAVVDEQKQEKF